MADESPQDEDEDIEFPAISPAPVLIALLNLVHALVIWVVAVTVHLPRYLLFSKQRRITLPEKEPTGETRRWCRENPGLRGFVLELQTPSNTFKAYKCNSTEPHPLKNDYVDGKFSFLLATDPPVNNLLEKTGRRFEMRIQGRCLTTPTDGRLFVGAELSQRPKLNIATKALVKGAMAFISRRTPGLEWSLNDDGKARCAFPCATGVDLFIATSEGQTPPDLRGELTEEDRVTRRASSLDNMPKFAADGTTYTLTLHSAAVDFTKWRVANMPIGSPSLDSLMGPQPIDVVVYDRDPADATKKRYWLRYRCRWDAALARFAERGDTATQAPRDAPPCRSGCAVVCDVAVDTGRGYAVVRDRAAAPPLKLVARDGGREPLADGDVIRVQSEDTYLTSTRQGWLAWRESKGQEPRKEEFFVLKTDGPLTLRAPFSLVSLVRPESCVGLATGAPSSRYGGRLLRLRKKCPAEDVVRLRALDFVEDSEDFEEYDDVEEDQGWRVSTIACAGFVEVVDRRAMRACRAYALVATLTSETEQKQVTRLRTADELAAVLGLTAASLNCGPGGGVPTQRRKRDAAKAQAAKAVQTATKVKDGLKHAASRRAAEFSEWRRRRSQASVVEDESDPDSPAALRAFDDEGPSDAEEPLMDEDDEEEEEEEEEEALVEEEPVEEEAPVIEEDYYADPDDSEIPDRGPPASILNEGSPWAAPVTTDRPPFHRSAGDRAAHLLRRRLDAWLETAHDNEKTRRDAWGLVGRARVLDEGFLRGGAAEVGVTSEVLRRQQDDSIAVVARSLGEGHWAEQLAVLRKGRLDVLDALGSPKKVALPLNEVLACRFVEGPFPTLVVETVGLCHYLGFADEDRRDAFATALSIARSRAAEFAPDETTRDPRDAFILKPPSYKQARLVLNARRLSFDLVEEEDELPPWARARNLLRRLAAASPDAAATAQAELFDEAASLKRIALADVGSPLEALAFFLNLYHALLLHALLVLGAPRDATTFSKQVSYDVCGDVFSLNDLAQCVLRGRLRQESEDIVPEATTATRAGRALDAVRAKLPKRSASPPKPPTPSNARSPALDDAHWALALAASDGRVALAAHSGARDFPSVIMEADPATLPATLDAACARFLDRPGCVSVDERRRVVALPAACELLVADPEPRDVVRALLRFVGKRLWHRLSALLRDEAPVAVVYRPAARRFHEALELSSV
mmetsp:Transcript_10904/g.28711  ORF Transcript_10904/g.28711 Transcript_10904/m.28711 type:complete len:1202 (-) Transcript_10904:26-3631(-)